LILSSPVKKLKTTDNVKIFSLILALVTLLHFVTLLAANGGAIIIKIANYGKGILRKEFFCAKLKISR
jgi:hypothetical protein